MRIAAIALVALFTATQSAPYRAEIETFQKQRESEIAGRTGWAALVGLHWLTPGTFTIGRAAGNGVVLAAPSAPDRLGNLLVTESSVTLHVTAPVHATVKGAPVTTVELKPNTSVSNGLVVGGMTMVVIRRSSKLALRVWDSAGQGAKQFTGLMWHPIDPAWRIEARFVEHPPGRTARIMNVLGEVIEMPNPGVAEFTRGGEIYRLEALIESPGELFFMFRDATSKKTTYAAGRYLYTPMPQDGRVVLDFNKAKNPPCAFTEFATCPLPPPRNRLALAVTAGELFRGH
jgi:uncharacterized protein (DUF1684 family)